VVKFHVGMFLTSALDRSNWSPSRLSRFTPLKNSQMERFDLGVVAVGNRTKVIHPEANHLITGLPQFIISTIIISSISI
jgi:hypothetical protein